jgi:hypothetical protein
MQPLSNDLPREVVDQCMSWSGLKILSYPLVNFVYTLTTNTILPNNDVDSRAFFATCPSGVISSAHNVSAVISTASWLAVSC